MTDVATPDAASVLRTSVRSQRRLMIGSALLYMSWQACESLVPVAIGAVIDHAITGGDDGVVARWIVLLAALFLVLSMSFRFASRLSTRAAQRAAHDLRAQVAARVLDVAAVPHPDHRAGTTVSIAGNDADRAGMFCAAIPRTCGALVSVVVVAVVALTISVPLGLLVLLGCPALLVVLRLLVRLLERRSSTEQAHAADAASLATDVLRGLRVLKGIGGERAAADRYDAASERALAATLRSARTEAAFDAATLLLTVLFLATVALVGGRLAADGRIEVGQLVAAVGLAQFLIGPLSGLSSVGAIFARARASAGRIASVLAMPQHPAPSRREPASRAGRLRVPALGLDVAPGELIGIAAAVDDAAAIVAGLAAPRVTGIELDGQHARTLAAGDLAASYVVAPHDAAIFAESLLDNVRGHRGSTDDQVVGALRAADADEVAGTLADGPATVLAEQGRSLSGGQRQRVTLARALAADPLVLVLHDPTTAVDGVTEARIADGVRELRAERTTVVVATSPALLARCDRVLYVRDGAVVGGGTHDELAAGDGGYRSLVLS